MAFSAPLSHVVLVITAAVLFYVALTDFKQFKIRNELILVLAGLFACTVVRPGERTWQCSLRRAHVLRHVVFLCAELDGWRRRQDMDRRLSMGQIFVHFP
jgi:Flp pilus assembly protein protease CpaA